MAKQQISLPVTQMHAVSFAITEKLTVGTLPFAHPLAVTIRLIFVIPHLHKVILINIALMIVGTDAGTSRNSTVHQNRPYRYPCLTMEEMIAHISLIVSEETFTAISRLYPSLLARTFDKLHHPAKIPVRQLQFRIFCRTADRKHSEKQVSGFSWLVIFLLSV